MAKLRCVLHDKRVQVIGMGDSVALTVHRNVGKTNDICLSNTLTIDEEYFTPESVLSGDWVEISETRKVKA